MLENGKYYHIDNRGNNRENIFKERKNYDYFLKLYAHHIPSVADTFAYCLLKNHFHLLIRIKDPMPADAKNPSQAFSNLFNAYTKAMNKMYGRTGSLFEKNFHRIEVDDDLYFARLIFYIHSNPQKHRFTDDFRDYPFSSYRSMTSDGPSVVDKEKVLQWFGGRDGFVEFHKNVSEEIELTRYIGVNE